jgi:SNF2 family DNA or RNA helicase
MSEPWRPKPYHKRAVRFGVERAAAGFFLDPGLGKTSITLAVFDVLRQQKLTRGVLVIAPLRVAYLVWPREVAKWKDFAHLRVSVLHGPKKAAALRRPADVYVINPEGLEWLFGALGPRTDTWPFDMLVIDESTKFKNTQTVRFKVLRAQLHRFRRRYILTGTPAPNGLIDLFGQIFVLDLGRALGQYVTHYRNAFFDRTGFGGYTYRPRPGAEAHCPRSSPPLRTSSCR